MSHQPGKPGDPSRRRFLQVATCALGGGVATGLAIPAVKLLAGPVGQTTVVSAAGPIEVARLGGLTVGAPPLKVPVVAPQVRDAWTAIDNVPLGAAWLRRTGEDQVEALSSICPHLGCAVGWDDAKTEFLCPCHDSRFSSAGARLSGPSPRGMDPLPLKIEDGRILVTWVRFRQGSREREAI